MNSSQIEKIFGIVAALSGLILTLWFFWQSQAGLTEALLSFSWILLWWRFLWGLDRFLNKWQGQSTALGWLLNILGFVILLIALQAQTNFVIMFAGIGIAYAVALLRYAFEIKRGLLEKSFFSKKIMFDWLGVISFILLALAATYYSNDLFWVGILIIIQLIGSIVIIKTNNVYSA